MTHCAQTQQLRDAIVSSIDSSGPQLVYEVEVGMATFLKWLNFLNSFKRTGTANELLDAVASTMRETAACIALGLVRPALFSMRTQIDLILAWLYFKDHPVEWSVVNRTGDGFKLKRELFDYLNNTVEGFNARYGILKQTSTRKEQDTYRLLSAHIHGQSNPVLPSMLNLCDVVREEAVCKEATELVKEVSEYVSDILYAIYTPNFASLPIELNNEIANRFASEKQRKEFYETI